jgi:GT2 family glycosyltransferase
VYVVDNRGDYRARGDEQVLRPGENLGWAGGCNYGLVAAQLENHSAYVLLNNDVRLSSGFLDGLVDAWRETDAALVVPVYDHNWPQQRRGYDGPAAGYRSSRREHLVPFIDGTCLFIPSTTLRRVGSLDEGTWPRYGWGCDKDYALRIRRAGGSVWATERVYLNHLARRTAKEWHWYDEREAEIENDRGMSSKWGPSWKEELYHSFPEVSREGLVQRRLAKEQ